MNNFFNSKFGKGRVNKNLGETQAMPVKLAPLNSKLSKIILLVCLVLLMGLGAVPGYLKGSWRWEKPLSVANLKQIRNLQKTGISLPNWQTLNQQPIEIGGHKWSFQVIGRDAETQAILLLRPMRDDKDMPQVEWVDLRGFRWWQTLQPRQWQTDGFRRSQFTVTSTNAGGQPLQVEAQYFRNWIQERNFSGTFAVLQWYAWPTGGNPEPNRWFFADQIAQWQGRRLPWVAVSIMIPIEPLGDIEPAWRVAESLGQTVQAALIADALKGS
ncbi:cyanoexosortase B system-associated protein [Microseira sp. BLCC-F43]|jgi:cyanoexosortase B-associated protein|uniref:cyanoexosortase B system-associated protein n=1 Tax=Microseira sp. BLCC-F43 TaxID=3153602 RepID=UPI0035B789B8